MAAGALNIFGCFVLPIEFGNKLLPLVVSAGMVAAGYFWMKSLKPTYVVGIFSASGESHALPSPDQQYVGAIVNAINNAIVQYQ